MKRVHRIILACSCCLALGLWGCGTDLNQTKEHQDDAQGDLELTSCDPGDTAKADCNTCVCTDDGVWECTEKDCDGSDDSSSNGDRSDSGANSSCKPGDRKQVDCNECLCTDEGVWMCTDAACDPGEEYDPCEGKQCGERCTQCEPGDPDCAETDVLKYCQPDGSCAPTEPDCGGTAECETDADCMATGCSGQICAAEQQPSTCEWREEYACYADYGSCSCIDGTCGWKQTDELTRCLEEK